MAYILDTGFLYAALEDGEPQHAAVINIIGGIREPIIFPVPAITEVCYLLMRQSGAAACADFVADLTTSPLTIETPLADDYRRAAEIIRQYADARIDFVDAIIVAIAERLNITRVLTIDERDFRMFRPRHCAAFELLP